MSRGGRMSRGLAAEHARLLGRVTARAAALLAAAAQDRWPVRELQALADCLDRDVLAQAAGEEAGLFPAGTSAGAVARLERDHRRLRAIAAAFARAAAGEGSRSGTELATATRDLLSQLERHLAAEQSLLAGS